MTDRFFLKSVVIENFKAIHRSGTVKLTPLTAFIGNNGSGKSSLIEALETYRTIVLDGLDAAMDRWHGIDWVWNKRSKHDRKLAKDGRESPQNPLGFHLKGQWEGEWGGGTFDVGLSACPEVGGNRMRIENEEIELLLPDHVRRFRRDWSGKCALYRGAGPLGVLPGFPKEPGVPRPTKPEYSRGGRVTTYLLGESASPPDWKENIRRWQFLSLQPEPMGAPTRQRMTGGPPMLNRDGSNLGEYLWSFRESSVEAFNDLLEALRFVLPYARDVQMSITQEIERLVYLEMTEENFKIPGWLLSTGTLRILALLACLRHPSPPPLLVVEEIENGLDPRTINLLVEELRAAMNAKKTQILITTHSPYMLDLLDLSHIVVVEREDGRPVFRRPDTKQLAEWSKSFSPGRLYTMGRLTRND